MTDLGRKTLRMLLWIVGLAGGLFLLFSIVLYFQQPKMVFFPSRAHDLTPAEIGLDARDVTIPVTNSESIHAWYFPVDGAVATIMLCHGNAGNISHRLESAQYWTELGANVLLFDYRGYGKSDGKPGEKEAYADAEAAYQWLRSEQQIPHEQIVIFGRSLGGAVAVDLAGRVPCRALVVESSFTSATAMGKRMFPFLPIGLLIRFEFDSLSKIGKLACPVLVTHSPDDEIVPYDMGQQLFDAANEPKRFVELDGGHNNRGYFDDPAYREALLSVINGTAARDFAVR
ncbi:alpha/beta fold hydrolase [candidate division GN15 bacterium]|nr:alpha/beta fold hydrolase [candidate division GN15 bacterium]